MIDLKLFSIEGNRQRLDGGAMFGNAPREMWRHWIEPDQLNRIELACRALLVQTSVGRNILFDVGIGAFFEPKLKERFGIIESEHVLINNLAAHGLTDSDIDAVVLSHLHFDHAGGLLSAHGDGAARLLFPNARYYLGREHWERARRPHLRDRASFIPILHELLEKSGRLVLVDKEATSHPDLDFGLSFQFVHGHTIGLMLATLDLPKGPLLFVADLIPGLPWMHIPITMGYDRFPELLIDEKQRVLEDLISRDGKVFFTHDPKESFAIVKCDDKGKFFGEAIAAGVTG